MLRLTTKTLFSSTTQTNLEMTSYVYNPLHPEADGPRPTYDWKTDSDGDPDKPEPEEGVDLLVKEVDWQDALKRVTVHGAHLADAEVAQRYRRKPLRPGADGHRAADDALELVTRQRVGDHLNAVHVIPGSEQKVEEQQLPADVGNVQHLGGGVQRHQIVAVSVADAKAEQSSGE